MNIRDILIKISDEFPKARTEKLKGHPFRKFVEVESVNYFQSLIETKFKNIKVKSSAQQGVWLRKPWIVFLDNRITKTAQKGYYVSYSFNHQFSHIALHIGQGHDDLKIKYGKSWKDIRHARALIIKQKLPEHSARFNDNPSKIKSFQVDERDYTSSVFGKVYKPSNLPSEEELEKDLIELVSLYQKLIQRGGTSEEGAKIVKRTWLEDIIQSLHNLGGSASRKEILNEIERIRPTLNSTWKNTVQKELESHSSDSEVWQNQIKKSPDLFESVYGIGKGYWKLRGTNNYSEEEEDLKGEEKKVLKIHKQKEYEVVKRNQKLINAVKKKRNYTCEACGLHYKNVYGEFDSKKPFIEAHHIIPVHKMELGESKIKDENDIAILCANCHRMIHKHNCPSLDDFKKIVSDNYKKLLKNI